MTFYLLEFHPRLLVRNELLVNFNLFDQEYGLYIPLDPFFIVGKLKDKGALLIEDDEFDKIQPLIENEIEKSSS